MNNVKLGRTGIVSPKNAFGALPIQRVSFEEAGELLRRAYEAGFTFFDTARAYTDSEEKMGAALADVRGDITIATKTIAHCADEMWRDLEQSLKNLRTEYIDIYQFHNPAVCPMPGDGTGLYEAAMEAKEKGLIRHIGITNHRMKVAEQAVKSGLYETLQYPLCYLATEAEMELVRLCRQENVGFIAMKALSGGLLTRADAAWAWLNELDNVLPIWGVQRMEELEQFISFDKQPPAMDEEMKSFIEEDRKALKGNFCRGCGYCMPCPMGIEINNCARMAQLLRRSPSAGWLSEESRQKMMNIENCTGCGQCISKCPYGLNTPELLKLNLEDYKNVLSGAVQV